MFHSLLESCPGLASGLCMKGLGTLPIPEGSLVLGGKAGHQAQGLAKALITKYHKLRWLKATEIYSHTVLEARYSKSRYPQGHAPSETLGKNPYLFLASDVAIGPWPFFESRSVTLISASVLAQGVLLVSCISTGCSPCACLSNFFIGTPVLLD